MFLRSLRIRNYSIHRDTQIHFSPITAFVGPNGGGKSAIFDAILNFSMISRGSLREAFGRYPFSYSATLHSAAPTPARISFHAELAEKADSNDVLSYFIEYSQTASTESDPTYMIQNEKVTLLPTNTVLFDRSDPPLDLNGLLENDRSYFSAIKFAYAKSRRIEPNPLVTHCAQQISRINRFRLEPSVLSQPSRLPETPVQDSTGSSPRIGYAGEDLAGTLYYMKETSAPELESIKEKIRETEPAFLDFDFNAIGNDRIGFSVIFSDGRKTVSAPRLSSGTLMYIGLAVLICSQSRPPIMMIEEPENGLTPQAIQAFYRSLKALSTHNDISKRSQILISSHSPFIICEAWNGEDREFIHQVKAVNGKSVVRKFSEGIKEHGIQLAKDELGQRTHLGLKQAEDLMSGRYA